MKNRIMFFTLAFVYLFVCNMAGYSQNANGIIYQAEARDNFGKLLKNASLDVKMTIHQDYPEGEIVWQGLHHVVSNNYGMFVLVIGEGEHRSHYDFEALEWGKAPHFLNVSVKSQMSKTWINMGTEKFLSVPYALHAKTAGDIVYGNTDNLKSAQPGVNSQNWSLFGNSKSDPEKDKLGTTDAADLVLVTNNEERMRLTADGKLILADGVDLEVGGNLAVNGDSTFIKKDLYVGRDVHLNVSDEFSPKGETLNYGAFTVEEGSPTTLTGALDVSKKTVLKDTLIVEGEARVKGRTTFDIAVTGSQSEQGSYPVLIKGSKQGLAIDLVQANDESKSQRGNNYISFWQDEVQKGRIEGMGRADMNNGDFISLICNLVSNPPEMLNEITDLSVFTPFSLEDYIEFDAGRSPVLGCCDDCEDCILGLFRLDFANAKLPSLEFVDFPEFEDPFSKPICEGGDILDFNKYMSDISGVSNPGTPAGAIWEAFETSYKSFVNNAIVGSDMDKDELAYSNYNLDMLTNLISIENDMNLFLMSFFGVQDPEDIVSAGFALINTLISTTIYGSFTEMNLGVAYESGAGDYAEWLLRADPEENINPGDVVGVIGGRISKKFILADKYMAVSTSPIVLGNMPENKKAERNADKVAFMGQVPVKVQGNVAIGDYILPSGEGNGIAIAVNPKNMLARDYKRIIGVAWDESKPGEYISLINTAVGINNNDMANVIEDMQFTLNTIQKSLERLDPEFVTNLYDVDITARELIPFDYSVSKTHKSNLSNYFEGKKYESDKEMYLDVKKVMINELGSDFYLAPVVNYLLEHPDKAEQISKRHSTILEEMLALKSEVSKK